MSPGERVEAAHKRAARAMGQIVFMLVKRDLSRSRLEWCAAELEGAAHDIRTVLTRDNPRE